MLMTRVLFFAAKTVAELEMVLGTDMNNVLNWMQENKLYLNGKTEYVVYGTHQNPRSKEEMSLWHGGSELKGVASFKYLGVHIDDA